MSGFARNIIMSDNSGNDDYNVQSELVTYDMSTQTSWGVNYMGNPQSDNNNDGSTALSDSFQFFSQDKQLLKNVEIFPLVEVYGGGLETALYSGPNPTRYMPLGEYGLYPNDMKPIGFGLTPEQNPSNPRMDLNVPTNYPENWLSFSPEGNNDHLDTLKHVKNLFKVNTEYTDSEVGGQFMYVNSGDTYSNNSYDVYTTNFYCFRIYGELGDNAWDLGSNLLNSSVDSTENFLQTDFGGMYTNWMQGNLDDAPSGNEGWLEAYSLQHIMPYIHYGWPFTLRVKQRTMAGSSQGQSVRTLTVRAINTDVEDNYWSNFYPTFYDPDYQDSDIGWGANDYIPDMLSEMFDLEQDPPIDDGGGEPPEPPPYGEIDETAYDEP